MGRGLRSSVASTFPLPLAPLDPPRQVTHSIIHHYYCIYCYFHGEYCNYCYYYGEYQWLHNLFDEKSVTKGKEDVGK